jgi:hypothetical protein
MHFLQYKNLRCKVCDENSATNFFLFCQKFWWKTISRQKKSSLWWDKASMNSVTIWKLDSRVFKWSFSRHNLCPINGKIGRLVSNHSKTRPVFGPQYIGKANIPFQNRTSFPVFRCRFWLSDKNQPSEYQTSPIFRWCVQYPTKSRTSEILGLFFSGFRSSFSSFWPPDRKPDRSFFSSASLDRFIQKRS